MAAHRYFRNLLYFSYTPEARQGQRMVRCGDHTGHQIHDQGRGGRRINRLLARRKRALPGLQRGLGEQTAQPRDGDIDERDLHLGGDDGRGADVDLLMGLFGKKETCAPFDPSLADADVDAHVLGPGKQLRDDGLHHRHGATSTGDEAEDHRVFTRRRQPREGRLPKGILPL